MVLVEVVVDLNRVVVLVVLRPVLVVVEERFLVVLAQGLVVVEEPHGAIPVSCETTR